MPSEREREPVSEKNGKPRRNARENGKKRKIVSFKSSRKVMTQRSHNGKRNGSISSKNSTQASKPSMMPSRKTRRIAIANALAHSRGSHEAV